MTTPSSRSISIQNIAAELSISVTGLSLNDSRVRGLVNVPLGTISMGNLRGKSNSYLIAGTDPSIYSDKKEYSSSSNTDAGGSPRLTYGSVSNIGRNDLNVYEIVTRSINTPILEVTIYGNFPPPLNAIVLNGVSYNVANARDRSADGGTGTTTWQWNIPFLLAANTKYSCNLV